MQSLGPLLTSSKAPARPGDKPGQTAPDRPAVKLRPSFGDELRALATSFDAKAAILCCVAAAMYTLSHFEGSIDFFLRFLAPHVNLGRFGDMGGDLYWLLMSNVFFGLVPLGMLLWLREPLSDYGLGLGDRRAGFAVTGLADSSNFVAFYDKNGFQARIAANWRKWLSLSSPTFAAELVRR